MEDTVIDANPVANSSDATSMLSSPDFVGTADGGKDAGKDGITDDKGQGTDDKSKAAAGADDKGADDKGGNDDDGRFDKHPRFQELHKRATEAEAKLSILAKSPVGMQEAAVSEIPVNDKGEPIFKDITKMSAAEVREWQEDDPIGFEENQRARTLHEISIQNQKAQQAEMRKMTFEQISKTFDDYAAEHSDFSKMWDSGEIETYMRQHPGHNAISAHMAITATGNQSNVQKMIDEAVAKARKEERELVTKNFQAKRNATVIDSGTPTRGTTDGIDPALQDTNKFGGRNTVLANRLAELRRAATR